MDDARQHFEEALEIYRQPAQQNPIQHYPIGDDAEQFGKSGSNSRTGSRNPAPTISKP